MFGSIPVWVMLVSGMAEAQDYQSEPQQVVFEGGASIIDQKYVFPLTVDAGFVYDLGVTATITASSSLFVHMEGESDVFWPDPTGNGQVRQTITPLTNGAEIAMDSEVTIDVDFGFSVDIWGITGTYSFNLLSEAITFRPRIEDFIPFLLPSQPEHSMRVDADPTSGVFKLEFPIQLVSLFSPDILGISMLIGLYATPLSYSIVEGVALDTAHESDRYRYGDPTFPVSIALYENPGYADLASYYTVATDTVIGYHLVGEGTISLDILGFSFPFTITFLDLTINLFTGSEQATYETGPYRHPLPAVELPIPSIDFGTVEVDDIQSFTFPLNNDGELELEAIIELEGDDVFEVNPNEVYAGPGSQDAAIVMFRPDHAGEFTGSMTLWTSDPLRPEIRVPIKGRAVLPADDGFNDDDNGLYSDGGSSTLYTGCGCATPGQPLAAWTVLGLLLVARRRRDQR